MTENLKKYQEMDLEVYIIVNKFYWDKYKKLTSSLPFETKFIDPASKEAAAFIQKVVELNEKAYGDGMAAPYWTYANFGTIGAGITAGFLLDGTPISQLSLVGNISDEKVAHEWTLLVDPMLEGQAIGSLTYALVLHLCQDKDFLTFIMQTDNSSVNIYLKSAYPLMITSYGFVHTRKNSFLIKTKIPGENGFENLLDTKVKQYNFEDYPEAGEEIIPEDKCFWVHQDNHKLYRKINDSISQGQSYSIKAKEQKGEYMYLLLEKA
jgi:hypothetical protein